jgi:hypothetical protein
MKTPATNLPLPIGNLIDQIQNASNQPIEGKTAEPVTQPLNSDANQSDGSQAPEYPLLCVTPPLDGSRLSKSSEKIKQAQQPTPELLDVDQPSPSSSSEEFSDEEIYTRTIRSNSVAKGRNVLVLRSIRESGISSDNIAVSSKVNRLDFEKQSQIAISQDGVSQLKSGELSNTESSKEDAVDEDIFQELIQIQRERGRRTTFAGVVTAKGLQSISKLSSRGLVGEEFSVRPRVPAHHKDRPRPASEVSSAVTGSSLSSSKEILDDKKDVKDFGSIEIYRKDKEVKFSDSSEGSILSEKKAAVVPDTANNESLNRPRPAPLQIKGSQPLQPAEPTEAEIVEDQNHKDIHSKGIIHRLFHTTEDHNAHHHSLFWKSNSVSHSEAGTSESSSPVESNHVIHDPHDHSQHHHAIIAKRQDTILEKLSHLFHIEPKTPSQYSPTSADSIAPDSVITSSKPSTEDVSSQPDNDSHHHNATGHFRGTRSAKKYFFGSPSSVSPVSPEVDDSLKTPTSAIDKNVLGYFNLFKSPQQSNDGSESPQSAGFKLFRKNSISANPPRSLSVNNPKSSDAPSPTSFSNTFHFFKPQKRQPDLNEDPSQSAGPGSTIIKRSTTEKMFKKRSSFNSAISDESNFNSDTNVLSNFSSSMPSSQGKSNFNTSPTTAKAESFPLSKDTNPISPKLFDHAHEARERTISDGEHGIFKDILGANRRSRARSAGSKITGTSYRKEADPINKTESIISPVLPQGEINMSEKYGEMDEVLGKGANAVVRLVC